MIQIYITKVKYATIVEVVGHANYAPKGHDIVCSAISVLFQTLHKTIIKRSQAYTEFSRGQNDTSMLFISEVDEVAQNALNYFLDGCTEVSIAYPMNVEVSEHKFMGN